MILGYYNVLSELGSGTFGTVLKVTDVRTGDVSAMKCISKSKIQRNKMGDQVKKEINTMKVLRHPNIVQIKDVLMDKTHLYITMDYVNGGELYSKIAERGFMPEGVARRYFRQVLEGVRYCHGINICHRDIKPENILLSSDDVVKIADFGFASIMEIEEYKKPSVYQGFREESLELDEFITEGYVEEEEPRAPKNGFKRLESKIMMKLSTICGTSMYMAPEIMKRGGYFGDKADMWSCGVVLYFLLMSDLPFDERDFESNTKKICEASYKISGNLSLEVRDLLSKLLMYDPSSRISARKALEHSWFKDEGTTSVLTPSPTKPTNNVSVPVARQLPVIREAASAYTGDKVVVSSLDVRKCVSKSSISLTSFSWTHKSPTEDTTVINAAKMTATGMCLIQLLFASKGGETHITLEISGDDTTSGANDMASLVESIRASTSS